MLQFLVLTSLSAYQPTEPSEVRALQALYSAAGGAAWSVPASKAWLRGDPCGDAPYYCGEKCNGWYGVASCWGPGGHVRKLDLRGAQLKGTLPSQIGLLTELATLDLSQRAHAGGGGLSGSMPSELGLVRAVSDRVRVRVRVRVRIRIRVGVRAVRVRVRVRVSPSP